MVVAKGMVMAKHVVVDIKELVLDPVDVERMSAAAAAAAVAGSSGHPPKSKAKASFVDDADVDSDASSSDSSGGSSSSSSSSSSSDSGSDSEDDDEIGATRSAERKRPAETSSVPDGLSDNGAASKKRKYISPDPTRAS